MDQGMHRHLARSFLVAKTRVLINKNYGRNTERIAPRSSVLPGIGRHIRGMRAIISSMAF
jgi:hypothetical protein